MPIQWDALQTANPFSSYMSGQKAGEADRQATERRKAINLFSTNPQAAEDALIAAGDFDTAESIRKRREAQAAQRTKTQVGEYVAKGDYKGAQNTAVTAGEFGLAGEIQKLNDGQRKAARDNAETVAAYAQSLTGLPYEQAKARVLSDKAALAELGFTPEQIDRFDPTPENLQVIIRQGMDLKTALEQANKDRDFGLRKEDTAADNRRADAQLGVSRGQLGVAQGNLRQRQVEHIERKAQGGYGAPRILGTTLPEGY